MAERSWKKLWPPELPYNHAGMSLEKALIILEGAQQKAAELDFSMVLVVCDVAGHPVALHRMDDAPLASMEIAENKARTAVFGKIPTLMWKDSFTGDKAPLIPLWFHSGWISFMGGFPIIMQRCIIGGLGCSGATWEDGVIALAGLRALGAETVGVEACLEKFGVPREKW